MTRITSSVTTSMQSLATTSESGNLMKPPRCDGKLNIAHSQLNMEWKTYLGVALDYSRQG